MTWILGLHKDVSKIQNIEPHQNHRFTTLGKLGDIWRFFGFSRGPGYTRRGKGNFGVRFEDLGMRSWNFSIKRVLLKGYLGMMERKLEIAIQGL